MELLALPGGGASLEFHSHESPDLIRALGRMGGYVVGDHGAHQLFRFDGAELAYLPSWAAPCLIAHDGPSTELLHRITAAMAAGD